MLSTSPIRGGVIPVSSAMWPLPLAPISSTRKRVSAATRRAVSGSPISLLKEPSVYTVLPIRPSSWAIRSLVPVFPAEPVRPITVVPTARAVTAWASRPSAGTTSSTTTAGTPTGREARTATAPRATAPAA